MKSDAAIGETVVAEIPDEMLSAAALAHRAAVRATESIPTVMTVLTKRSDAPPIGAELDALVELRATAKRLKTAETEFRAAQQAYGEAVRKLSEEATK